MKILVTSANCGGKCHNIVNKQINHDVEFICFDNFNNSYPSRSNSMHPRLVGKIPKMLSWYLYPNYDIYMWIDHRFSLLKNNSVDWFVNELSDYDAIFFAHPSRNKIYDEYHFCKSGIDGNNQYLSERYFDENMDMQINNYKLSNESDNLLIAAGAFMYKAAIIKNIDYNIMKEWFFHNCIYSVQDQLSLPYLLKKFDINFKLITSNIFLHEYLT